jgi:membrane-associated phospholipid phosphatase
MIRLKCLCIVSLFVLISGAGQWSAYAVTDAARDTASNCAADEDTLALPSLKKPAELRDSLSLGKGSHFFTRLGEDFAIQATSPFRVNGKQAVVAGAGLGITAGLIVLDEGIDKNVRSLRADHPLIRNISPTLTQFGSTYGILTAVAYTGYSVIWDDEEAQRTSMLIAEALITSGVWTRLGKLLAGRERPSAAYIFSHDPGGRWSGLGGSLHRHSNESISKFDAFPSGHTATAFAIATVFAKRYNESTYLPVFAYSFATIVGFTRMIEHAHWASDVFAGACIGYLCADQVVTHEEDRHDAGIASADRRKTKINFSIGLLNDSPALQLAVGF